MVYIDDVNIYFTSFKQHILDIQEVFELIRQANHQINPKKYHFSINKIQFLEYVVGVDRIKPDFQKIDKLNNLPLLKTITNF
ncbi:17393_t:CDS:1, partial [Dentiscutata heterogama]